MENCNWFFPEQTIQSGKTSHNALTQMFRGAERTAFIRESIQNSLDAADGDQTVRFVIRKETLKRRDYPNLFSLEKHIEACKDMHARENGFWTKMCGRLKGDEIECLRLSDYGTTGMKYNPDDFTSPFYSFACTIGNSCKNRNDSGGSFGYGKGALYLASDIRTLFVSSMAKDGTQAFLGRAMIATHKMNGKTYIDEGVYNLPGTSTAVTDQKLFPEILKRTEPGTDILIPCNKGISADEIVREVIENFWMTILKPSSEMCGSGLEVTIDLGGTPITINRENIAEIAAGHFNSEDNPKTNPLTYINMIRRVQSHDECVHIEKRELEHLGTCMLYLMKLQNGEDVVCKMRKQGMVINYDRQGSRSGYVGLFWCISREGNELLKKCEDPTHTRWNLKDGTLEPEDKPAASKALRSINDFINISVKNFLCPNGVQGMDITMFDKILGDIDSGGRDTISEQKGGETVRLGLKARLEDSEQAEKISGTFIYQEDAEEYIIIGNEGESDPETEPEGICLPAMARNSKQTKKEQADETSEPEDKKGRIKPSYSLQPFGDRKKIAGRMVECDLSVMRTRTENGFNFETMITPKLPKGLGAVTTDAVVVIWGTEGRFFKPVIGSVDGYEFEENIIKDVVVENGIDTKLNIRIKTKIKQAINVILYAKPSD